MKTQIRIKNSFSLAFASLTLGATLLGGNSAKAQIIYDNNFTLGGAVTIEGTAPTVANTFAGGSSSALWNNTAGNLSTAFLANGTPAAANNSTLLDFTPVSGNIYRMTGKVNLPANSGNYVGMGFSQFNPNTATSDPRFSGNSGASPVRGYDWMLVRTTSGTLAQTSEQFFAGLTTANVINSADVIPTGTAGLHTLEINLDTTSALWSTWAVIDGTAFGSVYNYTVNPTIGAAGLTQNGSGLNGVTWDSWKLEVVPEPSAATLIGFGLLAFLGRLRRRN